MAVDNIEELEAAIYEAAVVPQKWGSVLDSITEVASAQGGVFFGVTTVMSSWIASAGLRDRMEEFVTSGWAARNTRMAIGLEKGLHHVPRFVTEADYYAPGELEKEAIYNEFFYLRGLGHSAGTIAILPHQDMLCISFERGRDVGPFDAPSLARLDALRPHLMRASLVTARLGMEQIRTAIETLTAIGLPAAAVSQNGKVIEANAPFADAVHIWTTRGDNRIALFDKGADAMLREGLSMLDRSAATHSIPVRSERGGPMVAVVQMVPLRRLALDIFGNTAAILILSQPKSELKDPSLLLSLFDLTPAELDVAQSVAGGLTVSEIAQARRRSISTVRNQLRTVMLKTGSTRQADLILLLGTLPVRV